MNKYRVRLSPYFFGHDDEDHFFECSAENDDHAKEQAENAYPEDFIIGIEKA